MILAGSFIALVVTIIGFLVTIIIQFKRTRTSRSISLPVTITVIQLVIGVLAIILTRAITALGG